MSDPDSIKLSTNILLSRCKQMFTVSVDDVREDADEAVSLSDHGQHLARRLTQTR